MIIRSIITSDRVEMDNVMGAVCTYLLIGYMWANFYGPDRTRGAGLVQLPRLRRAGSGYRYPRAQLRVLQLRHPDDSRLRGHHPGQLRGPHPVLDGSGRSVSPSWRQRSRSWSARWSATAATALSGQRACNRRSVSVRSALADSTLAVRPRRLDLLRRHIGKLFEVVHEHARQLPVPGRCRRPDRPRCSWGSAPRLGTLGQDVGTLTPKIGSSTNSASLE